MNLFEKNDYLYPLFIGFVFFIASLLIMHNGHFHEDAYILFIYVENFVNGNGITYFPGAPPIEGATDFLWMILISILVFLGIDSGTAVLILNSVGVFIVSLLISKILLESKEESFRFKFFYFVLPLLWIPQSFLLAGIGGFSVYLYLGLISLAVYFIYHGEKCYLIPLVGIALSLFRPDGVILAIGFWLVSLYLCSQNKEFKKFAIYTLIAFVIGVVYFLWRYNYFGNLLPLPLYVKSSEGGLAGLGRNMKWINHDWTSVYLLAIVFLSIVFKKLRVVALYSVPAVLLYVALMFATQSQNIGYRFQAPLFIISFLIFVVLVGIYLRTEKDVRFSKFLITLPVIVLTVSSYKNVSDLSEITAFNYINEFPKKINELILSSNNNDVTIALTEAGRLAYWNQSAKIKIIDLVGLNTPYTAKNQLSIEYMESISPDIIMFHHARTIDIGNKDKVNSNHLVLSDRASFDPAGFKNPKRVDKVIVAANVASEYLFQHFDRYDVIAVDYREDGGFYHIYALKKKLGIKAGFLAALDDVFLQRRDLSYYQMK
ncbi:hypothetical protein [Thiomicrorhabdus sp. 6S3-12]|uniref:hypothetical protein n=1 Tax=Thiomicrorhabdus sp. 6S3-12 TaxID=2819681 RepID=UPI001AADCD54|nr:hypothetical protein [Thiomicrorhabdus sp. 6S3-12]MBO1924388.1 hypothetical protein [Thiomicrorhabdus sp. 6S3-12]